MSKFYFLMILLFGCQAVLADPVSADDAEKSIDTAMVPATPKLAFSTAIALPDIPEPAKFDTNVIPLQNGVQVKGSIDGDQFLIKPDFNNAKGVLVDAGIVSQKIPATTMGWMLSSRPDKTEAVMNMGWRPGSNQQLLFSAAQLHELVNSDIDGKLNLNLNQTSGGLDYRYFIDRPWLTGLELSGYTSEHQGINSVIDNQSRFTVGNIFGMRLGLEAAPLPDAKLKIGFGGERLSYDSLSGYEAQQNLNTSIRWSQILMPTLKYNAAIEGRGAERILATGLDINLQNGQQLGLKLAHTQWSDGQPTDNVVQLTYNLQFGKKFTPFQFKGDNTPWNSSIANEVLQRPGYLSKAVTTKPETGPN